MPSESRDSIDWNDPDIERIRRDMLRFTQLQLRDAGAAEDMVQEALLAAMSANSGFDGRSALKTWMFAILRNKIVDHLRRGRREIASADLSTAECACEERVEHFFERRMLWQRGLWNREDQPRTWEDPDAALSQKQFWDVFDACVNGLPERTARIFMMREFLEFDTDEICTQLDITTNNCWVILHRARTALRACLAERWFHGEARQ